MSITSALNLYCLNSTTCCRRYIHYHVSSITNYTAESQFLIPASSTIRYSGFKFPHSPSSSLNSTNHNTFQFFQTSKTWWDLSDSGEVVEHDNEKNSATVFGTVVKMWELLGNEKWIMVAAFTSLVIAAVAEITMPRVLAESIFAAQNGQPMIFSRNTRFLGLLCLISGISSGFRSVCFAISNVILVNRLREALYSALIFQDMNFFDSQEVGGLTSRLGSDCQRLSSVVGKDIHLIVRNVLQGTGAMINLLCLSCPLAFSSILIGCVLATIFLVYGRYQKRAAKLTQDFISYANETAEETFSMIRTVRIYGTEKMEFSRYKHWLEKLDFVSFRESAAYGLWNMSFHSLYRATQVVALLLGGMSIWTGHVSTEQLTKYILYCEWLIYATWRVVDSMSSLLQAVGASEKVFQLMQLPPSKQFLSNGVKLQRLTGQIHFIDVTFHYPSRPTVPILKNFNLCIEANEVVALVGRSGSGKTTLVNLLLRLYEPTNGLEPQLFRTDMKSNISYGCHRDVNIDDIENAAKLAHAHEFISSLPDGYETLVDDELLSGGQKQQIAIARAILRNPAILILDEPTSALDPESEHYVKGILHALKNEDKIKRSVIVIAHRLSTIKAADRIIVMDGGRIVEIGNHVQLLRKDGLYSRLIKLQESVLA
ncbi:ABC transporter B family member 26, chloroplastic-like isoform X2 [Mercurialis annua]|uniref:ABC transporter B family member 26, chloroplastic-like isoform X2 n=1 Tax=Mercurialis annua TaxID=3986 RepID=UPI0024AC8B36|nr:ABC transporter B family member 26, chloroplastic-like isoform X2 [Mercurialis annua]